MRNDAVRFLEVCKGFASDKKGPATNMTVAIFAALGTLEMYFLFMFDLKNIISPLQTPWK